MSDNIYKFELNLFPEKYDLSEIILYEDGELYFKELITETTTNTSKKNIFRRLWNMIIKCIKWIADRFKKLFKFISSIFTGKQKKTADQCLEEAIPDLDKNKSSNTNPTKIDTVPIHIRSNPLSSVKPISEINLMFKPFVAKFNQDAKSVVLDFNHIMNSINNPLKQGKVVGQIALGGPHFVLAAIFIKYSDLLKSLEDVINASINQNVTYDELNKKFSSFKTTLKKYSNFEVNSSFEISLDELKEFQINVNNLNDKLTVFDKIDSNIENEKIEIINNIAGYAGSLQIGINFISSTITQCYVVDAAYKDCIDNSEDLSKFIQISIESGIPPKYIMYNSYILANEKLKGDGSGGNENDPIWGQTRVILFPPGNKIVHKIALSTWGLRANKVEESISRKFNEVGKQYLLSNVVAVSKNRYVIDSQYANMNYSHDIPVDKINKLLNSIESVCRSNNIKIDITYDLHRGNIGMRNNRLVAVDYGNAQVYSGRP